LIVRESTASPALSDLETVATVRSASRDRELATAPIQPES